MASDGRPLGSAGAAGGAGGLAPALLVAAGKLLTRLIAKLRNGPRGGLTVHGSGSVAILHCWEAVLYSQGKNNLPERTYDRSQLACSRGTSLPKKKNELRISHDEDSNVTSGSLDMVWSIRHRPGIVRSLEYEVPRLGSDVKSGARRP